VDEGYGPIARLVAPPKHPIEPPSGHFSGTCLTDIRSKLNPLLSAGSFEEKAGDLALTRERQGGLQFTDHIQ
jgi:hypothetical protein